MKRIVLLVSFLAVVALCAQAQTYINFSEMPQLVKSPTPMPDYYPSGTNLVWDNFLYVTPGVPSSNTGWTGGGPGFLVDPVAGHNVVAFFGGPYCNVAASCSGVIKMVPGPVSTTGKGFQPISISATAGWQNNTVVITAYNNSKFLGSFEKQLTATPLLFKFPVAWTNVTKLVFTPKFNLTTTNTARSMVIYSFVLVQH